MTTLPMSSVLPVVKAAFFAALAPLVGIDPEGLPRVYWEEAPEDTGGTPYLVFQSQDKGGRALPYVGGRGWTGFIVVKGYGTHDDEIDQLMPEVEIAVNVAEAAEGYSLRAVECNPITLRPDRDLVGSGLNFRMSLHINP